MSGPSDSLGGWEVSVEASVTGEHTVGILSSPQGASDRMLSSPISSQPTRRNMSSKVRHRKDTNLVF